jgi:transcriptional regulator with XRE-family HTH domain
MDVIKLSNLLKELAGDDSAEVLAEKIGLPPQTVRNYINRPGTQPGIDKLVKIANYMGVTLDDLNERLDMGVERKRKAVYRTAVTVEDGYEMVKSLPEKSRVVLCARLLAETSASYSA